MAQVNAQGKVQFHLKEGALHEELHEKPGQKIPVSELAAEKKEAEKSGNTTLEKRVVFAMNARHFNHSTRVAKLAIN